MPSKRFHPVADLPWLLPCSGVILRLQTPRGIKITPFFARPCFWVHWSFSPPSNSAGDTFFFFFFFALLSLKYNRDACREEKSGRIAGNGVIGGQAWTGNRVHNGCESDTFRESDDQRAMIKVPSLSRIAAFNVACQISGAANPLLLQHLQGSISTADVLQQILCVSF